MSCSVGDYIAATIRDIKEDTRSVDYSSYERYDVRNPHTFPKPYLEMLVQDICGV